MAVTPKDSDTFLREVDEELRRERVNSFVARWGWYILGGAVLLLAAIGGYIWWQHHQNVQAGQASEKLIQSQDQLDARNARGAAATIDELASSDRAGYRIAALFQRANAQIQTNAVPAAVETLKGIANDASAPQPYRDAALIRQTQLEFDSLNANQIVQRLQGLAQPGNAWHGTAGEMLGIAMIKANRPDQAARIFGGVARDDSVPASIRSRAVQMASSLGVDVSDINAAGQPGQGGAPAAAPPAAQPAPAQPAQPKQ